MAEGDGLSGMPPDRDGIRRALLVGSIVVAVLAAGAVGVWALWFRGGDDADDDARKPSFERAQPTSATASADATGLPAGSTEETSKTSPDASGSVPATDRPPGHPVPSVTPAKPVARAPYVAYRLGGRIFVARENGASSKPVATSVSGVFALSPDARTLAVVDYTTGGLRLVDVAKATSVTVGPATQVTPVWSPDSKRLLFVHESPGHRQDVYQVSRAGTTGVILLGVASRAAFSPDGRVIALAASTIASPFGPSEIVLLRDAKLWRRLMAPGPVTDVALGADRAYVAVAKGMDADGEQTEGIWALAFDPKAKPVRLVWPEAADDRGVLGMLCLSPDTVHLAYARAGDDGYARMGIIATSGGVPVLVSARKDTYPMGWSADSSVAFFIEGNGWQGEPTALERIRPDGTRKVVLVAGAER